MAGVHCSPIHFFQFGDQGFRIGLINFYGQTVENRRLVAVQALDRDSDFLLSYRASYFLLNVSRKRRDGEVP